MRFIPRLLVVSASLTGMLFNAGCNQPPEASLAPPKTTVGTEIDDSIVTARVKSALLADADVKSFDLKVETRKGKVQLSGFVDNPAQMNRAISIVRDVEGAKSVENKVTLKGPATTAGDQVDDGMITAKVKAALLADANIKSLDIAVVTRKGEVQLSGFVDNQTQLDRAVEVATAVENVRIVGNGMSIKK
jgi:hyperosmotically inducible periplasmic protein